ncbi:MAG: hypothetical protein HW421_1110 [Ignavibacteria bacterium]|nr:hypothetical protein [Ignavibacteria bacterium]
MKTDWQKEIFDNRIYWGKIVAISGDKIVEIANNYQEMRDKMKNSGIEYFSHTVPKNPQQLRIMTLKIKSMRKDLWEPFYPVKFFLPDESFEIQNMLIDSGADISAIDYNMGKSLGFEVGFHETLQTIEGIGGDVTFLLREQKIDINGHSFVNTFAWLQDPDSEEMIIGRKTVFDLFDIEFKQTDKEIIFRKRQE